MRLALITRQIGHYHDARFRGAAARIRDFLVISVANEGGFREFLASDTDGYPVERIFPDCAHYEIALTNGTLDEAMSKTLDRLAPDVIAVAGWATPESFAAIGWAHRNARGIVMMSESQAFDGKRSLLREMIKARVVSLCDAALVGGPTHREYIMRLGIPRERVHLGYNAVGNHHFKIGAARARRDAKTVRAELGLPPRYVLASARFIVKKNLPELVSAYARARAAVNDPPDLVILGDGPMRAKVEAAVSAHDLAACVHLPGFRGYDQLPSYYALAHGFAHVSLVEQWGLVINEAMASGTPVVVSRPCGAARALIEDGVNGLLVEPEEQDSIARGLSRLFALDDAARQEIGSAGQRTIAQWGPERFGEGLYSAAKKAFTADPRPPLSAWETGLLRLMGRQKIEAVV